MEELIPIIVAVLWIALGFLGKVVEGRRKKKGDQEPTSFERMLQEMAREQSADPLQPAHPPQPAYPAEPTIPSEHRPTASERQVTLSEHRPTASERQVTLSEHRPTASERQVTLSEHRPTASEHQRTSSEHRKGDLVAPRVSSLAAPAVPKAGGAGRYRSRLATELLDDLQGGRRPLARAILLREILGPPVGLRQADGREGYGS